NFSLISPLSFIERFAVRAGFFSGDLDLLCSGFLSGVDGFSSIASYDRLMLWCRTYPLVDDQHLASGPTSSSSVLDRRLLAP
ncbi:unnamed protein product, partial [Brassica rapa subsp. narinosa]